MNTGDEFALHEGKNIIGRAKCCDIMLFDRQCSRTHCMVYKIRDYHVIEDLASLNGTLVNGKPVKARRIVREHALLQVGDTVLQLSLQPVGQEVDRAVRIVTEELRFERFDSLLDKLSSAAILRHYRVLHPLNRHLYEAIWGLLRRLFHHHPPPSAPAAGN